MTTLKLRLAQALFIAFLVPFLLGSFVATVCRETWRALRYIYLEIRIDLADIPVQWRALRDL